MTEEMGLPKTSSEKISIDDADVTFSGRMFHSQQRQEKLDRRWLKDGCMGQQAMMSMQSGDADEPKQQMTATIPQRRTLQLSGVGICIPEQPA